MNIQSLLHIIFQVQPQLLTLPYVIDQGLRITKGIPQQTIDLFKTYYISVA